MASARPDSCSEGEMMRSIKTKLQTFLADERGETYIGFTYLVITIAASIPLGMACIRIYDSVCAAGGTANLVIGLF